MAECCTPIWHKNDDVFSQLCMKLFFVSIMFLLLFSHGSRKVEKV